MATPVRRILNASPLILLAKVGQLDLIRAGVPETLVPDMVLREVGEVFHDAFVVAPLKRD